MSEYTTALLAANAEVNYRRDRLMAVMHEARRPMKLRWPIGLISPRRRRPRFVSEPRPAPHHATSH
jgi:hypothetical protein